MQKRAPGGFSAPHSAQRGTSSVPQAMQKRAPRGLSAAQAGQLLVAMGQR